MTHQAAEVLKSERFASRSAAVTAVKLHSTKQNRQILQNKTKSNSSRSVLECASKVHRKGDDKRFDCKYKCVVRCSKAKAGRECLEPWSITRSTSASDMIHSENCVSRGNITTRECMLHTRNPCVRQIVASSSATRTRISLDNGIPDTAVKPHVTYRVRLQHAHKSNKNYKVNWTKLDEWGRQFMESNPGSRFHLETDKEGRFKRMFVGLACHAAAAQKTGIHFSGIDGTQFRGHYFNNGVALILDTRDGDNQMLVLAFVICLVENSDNYRYFARECAKVPGLLQYLNHAKSLLYSDRHKGIPAFEDYVTAFIGNCIIHILKNCRDWVRRKYPRSNLNFPKNYILDLQKARTAAEFHKQLNHIGWDVGV